MPGAQIYEAYVTSHEPAGTTNRQTMYVQFVVSAAEAGCASTSPCSIDLQDAVRHVVTQNGWTQITTELAPSTSSVIPALRVGAQYGQVRVPPYNPGSSTNWSSQTHFTVGASSPPPSAPTLVSPSQGETVGPRPQVRWNGVPGATVYELYLTGHAAGETDPSRLRYHQITATASELGCDGLPSPVCHLDLSLPVTFISSVGGWTTLSQPIAESHRAFLPSLTPGARYAQVRVPPFAGNAQSTPWTPIRSFDVELPATCDNPSGCVPTSTSGADLGALSSRAQAAASAFPTRPIFEPCPASGCAQLLSTDALYIDDDRSTHHQHSSALGFHTMRRSVPVGTSASIAPHTPPSWSTNGSRIDSCYEFVYQVDREFNAYEDMLIAQGESAYAAWAAAYAPGSIARRVLVDESGNPSPNQIAFPALCVSKNPFYEFLLPGEFETSQVGRAGCHDPQHPWAIEDWNYHETTGNALLSLYSPEQLEQAYAVARRFRDRVATLRGFEFRELEMVQALLDVRASGGLPGPCASAGGSIFPPGPGTNPWGGPGNGFDLPPGLGFSGPGCAEMEELLGPIGGNQVALESALAAEIDELQMARMFLEAELIDLAAEGQQMGCRPTNPSTPTPCDWAPSRFYDSVFDEMNASRTQLLNECLRRTADDFGRLVDPVFRDLNGVQMSQPPFGPADYASDVGSVFEFFAVQDAHQAELQAQADLAIEEIIANVPVDQTSRSLKTSEVAAGSFDKGNEWFGARFDYAVEAGVRNWQGDFCDSDPYATGTLTVTAQIAGEEFEALRAVAGAQPKPPGQTCNESNPHGCALFIDLDIVGLDVFTFARDDASYNSSFNLVSQSPGYSASATVQGIAEENVGVDQDGGIHTGVEIEEGDGASAGVQATVTIVFVPVTFRAGFAGEVGLQAKVDLGVSAQLFSGGDICDGNVGIDLRGVLAPYARLEAEAAVYVDLAIVGAGVRASLTIVDVRLPLEAVVGLDVQLHPGANGPEIGLDLTVDIGMKSRIVALSGKIALFVRWDLLFWSDEAEFVLAAWDGLVAEHDIFGLRYGPYNLAIFQLANEGLGRALP